MSAPNERSSGKFVRVGKPVPPTDVDCSSWERSAGPRSRGKLVGVAEHLPPVSGEFVPAPAWLELVVSFDISTPPAKVFEHTKQLVEAAARAVPELGLTYDFTRSRTENGDVVIALTPANTADVAKRLTHVAAVIQQATTQLPGVRRLVATVARAA
jgi:hypothetical protein